MNNIKTPSTVETRSSPPDEQGHHCCVSAGLWIGKTGRKRPRRSQKSETICTSTTAGSSYWRLPKHHCYPHILLGAAVLMCTTIIPLPVHAFPSTVPFKATNVRPFVIPCYASRVPSGRQTNDFVWEDDDDEEEDDDEYHHQSLLASNTAGTGNEEEDWKRMEASVTKQSEEERFGGGKTATPRGPEAAMCIVPPPAAWDRLQRARHFAKDLTYHLWPPALRLFHPLQQNNNNNGNDASYFDPLELAQVVEDLGIQSFEITLDSLVIVPHWQALQTQIRAMNHHTNQEVIAERDLTDEEIQDLKVRALIEREEEIGKVKKYQRAKRAYQKKLFEAREKGISTDSIKFEDFYDSDDEYVGGAEETTPEATFRQQQDAFEEFNGPCLVCLEPSDPDTCQAIKTLRRVIYEMLDINPRFTVGSVFDSDVNTGMGLSGSMISPDHEDDEGEDFRPVFPVGAFGSVTEAMEVAQQLKGLWDPLTFSVDELHIMSNVDLEAMRQEQLLDQDEREKRELYGSLYEELGRGKKKMFGNNEPDGMPMFSLGHVDGSQDKAWGCSAKVMLLGKELKQNDSANRRMVDRLWKDGAKGSFDNDEGYVVLEDGEGAVTDLEAYLDQDDVDDEVYPGSSLVIGRTVFYTGEKRSYPNMPATSTLDSKDRPTASGWTGAARRKANVHRNGNLWNEGDFGRKDVDMDPFNSRERGERRRRRNPPESLLD